MIVSSYTYSVNDHGEHFTWKIRDLVMLVWAHLVIFSLPDRNNP